MSPRLLKLIAIIALAMPATVARAGMTSSFVFDQANYLVDPGEKVDVTVYWQQTVTGGDVSVLNPISGVGMFGQGVQIRWDDPVMPTQPAKVLVAGDILHNSGFNDTGSMHKTIAGSYVQFSEVTDFSTFAFGEDMGGGVWRQLIGTFSFTAGMAPGETTHLRAMRYSGAEPGGDYIVDANVDVYDAATGQATAAIMTIPEPSASVLCGVAILAILAWYRRFNS